MRQSLVIPLFFLLCAFATGLPFFARLPGSNKVEPGLRHKDHDQKTPQPSKHARSAISDQVLTSAKKLGLVRKDGLSNEQANPNTAPIIVAREANIPAPIHPDHRSKYTPPASFNSTDCVIKEVKATLAYNNARAMCLTPGVIPGLNETECAWAKQEPPRNCCMAIGAKMGLKGRCEHWWPNPASQEVLVDAPWNVVSKEGRDVSKGRKGQ